VNLLEFDEAYRARYGRIAGLDEAGRGPLAGPVVASAVILEEPIEGVFDSKSLPPKERERLFEAITRRGKVGIGLATPEEIDVLNILNATKLAMERALKALGEEVDFLLVDGRHLKLSKPGVCVVKGDMKSLSIAAASIVAKVIRDRVMRAYSRVYSGYGFEHNFGYPTREHRDAIEKLGPTPFHRLTFSGVLEIVDDLTLSRWLEEGRIGFQRYSAVLRRKKKLMKQQGLF